MEVRGSRENDEVDYGAVFTKPTGFWYRRNSAPGSPAGETDEGGAPFVRFDQQTHLNAIVRLTCRGKNF
jgi:hypothetical protein